MKFPTIISITKKAGLKYWDVKRYLKGKNTLSDAELLALANVIKEESERLDNFQKQLKERIT
jgi:hypothetical protein